MKEKKLKSAGTALPRPYALIFDEFEIPPNSTVTAMTDLPVHLRVFCGDDLHITESTDGATVIRGYFQGQIPYPEIRDVYSVLFKKGHPVTVGVLQQGLIATFQVSNTSGLPVRWKAELRGHALYVLEDA